MCGEYKYSGALVERFACYHRQNYGGCKGGVSDIVIGAAATIADMSGYAKALISKTAEPYGFTLQKLFMHALLHVSLKVHLLLLVTIMSIHYLPMLANANVHI